MVVPCRDLGRIWGKGSTSLKEETMSPLLGHTEFEVLMGHVGGDQKTTKPWRLKLLAKLLVQASA